MLIMIAVWLSVTLVRQAFDYRVTLSTVTVSFISSVAVFALIFVVCIRFNVSEYIQYTFTAIVNIQSAMYISVNGFVYFHI